MPSSSRHGGRADREPSGVQRSYASQLKEHEPLFNSYEHLQDLASGDSALTMLRKIASLVKPIMRKRGWKVQILAEFLPAEANLLGLNINKGYKICIRLRYPNHPELFLPLDQTIDTMLHELAHNVWGDHDGNFHRLWDELRNEQETLMRKGYTGEGFLSAGRQLGGGRVPPPRELRRLARESAEKRKETSKQSKGSGQRLGGVPLHLQGLDVRQIIADQVTRRNTINRGCASGRHDSGQLSDQAHSSSFKTRAEEDDANNRAIAQALLELMQEEEERKFEGAFSSSAASHNGGLAWNPEHGLYHSGGQGKPEASNAKQVNNDVCDLSHLSEEEQIEQALQESVKSMHNGAIAASSGAPGTNMNPSARTSLNRSRDCSPVSEISGFMMQRTDIPSPLSPLTEVPPTDSGVRDGHLSISSTGVDQASPAGTAMTSHVRTTNQDRQATIPECDRSQAVAQHPAPSPINLVGLSDPFDPHAQKPKQWTCEICTCINPQRYLACDACGCERSQVVGTENRGARPRIKVGPNASTPSPNSSLGWSCKRCSAFMEHKWWTCSACGTMKESS